MGPLPGSLLELSIAQNSLVGNHCDRLRRRPDPFFEQLVEKLSPGVVPLRRVPFRELGQLCRREHRGVREPTPRRVQESVDQAEEMAGAAVRFAGVEEAAVEVEVDVEEALGVEVANLDVEAVVRASRVEQLEAYRAAAELLHGDVLKVVVDVVDPVVRGVGHRVVLEAGGRDRLRLHLLGQVDEAVRGTDLHFERTGVHQEADHLRELRGTVGERCADAMPALPADAEQKCEGHRGEENGFGVQTLAPDQRPHAVTPLAPELEGPAHGPGGTLAGAAAVKIVQVHPA